MKTIPSISSTSIFGLLCSSPFSPRGICIPLGEKATIPLLLPLPAFHYVASVVVGYHSPMVGASLRIVYPSNPFGDWIIQAIDSHHHQAAISQQTARSQVESSTGRAIAVSLPSSGFHSVIVEAIVITWHLDDNPFAKEDFSKGTTAKSLETSFLQISYEVLEVLFDMHWLT
jgi:hypothetical protein